MHRRQASGEAQYTTDSGLGTSGELYAAVVASTEALATIEGIDTAAALKVLLLCCVYLKSIVPDTDLDLYSPCMYSP